MTWEIWLIGVLGILCFILGFLVFILNKKSKKLSKENVVHDQTNEEDYRRDFVANVSHELRTPVSIIKGFSETLLEDFENIKEKKRKDFLEKINRNANRLHSLIEDLLLLAQFDGNPNSLKLQTVDLTKTIQEVVEECKSRWNPQELNVLLDLPNFEVPITVDPQKMISVFENLLENAFNHAKELSRITIRLKIIEKHTFALCEIEDDGQTTIAPAEIEKLFERFYRVDKSRSRARGGTGLGLSIVRDIIEAHKGQIMAKQSKGGGLIFTFKLPLNSKNP
jgi:signal transduction histidine kinase|tara:strand:+ start:201 stop:1040 length:840 start_codon:yes stop_codon:yes gene_type:complete